MPRKNKGFQGAHDKIPSMPCDSAQRRRQRRVTGLRELFQEILRLIAALA
jgi:hypothetical protein